MNNNNYNNINNQNLSLFSPNLSSGRLLQTESNWSEKRMKISEDNLNYKLQISKLNNQIQILSSKVKTYEQLMQIKDNENEIIKNKYAEILEEYKREIEKVKKTNSDFCALKDKFSKNNKNIKSTLCILLEILEILLSSTKQVYYNKEKSLIDNISCSIDIYDSYNNDEERRGSIIDQIQSLLLSKLNNIKRTSKIDLEKEIERVKSWNFNINRSVNYDNSKFNYSVKNIEESSDSYRKINSNECFDLSVSGQFVIQSPKFHSTTNSFVEFNQFENVSPTNINNINYKKDQILNDSLLKENNTLNGPSKYKFKIFLDDSFSDKYGHNVFSSLTDKNKKNYEINNEIDKELNNEMNVMDVSIIDLNTDNKSGNNNLNGKYFSLDLNDEASNINLEFQFPIGSGLNESFQAIAPENQELPIILQPETYSNGL